MSTNSSPEQQRQLFEQLTKMTPARLGVGRAGTRPLTAELLKLRMDHAEAVDAVYGAVSPDLLAQFGLASVDSQFLNKAHYLQHPESGRTLSAEAETWILAHCIQKPQVQIVVSDGLSAKAIDDQLDDVLPALYDSLKAEHLDTGTAFFVRGGRVGIMDDIGRLLQPETLVLLIGERPGLVTASSMSAYMCYRPRPGRTDADRTVISNIHRGGTPPTEAGAHIGSLLRRMIDQQASGVKLAI